MSHVAGILRKDEHCKYFLVPRIFPKGTVGMYNSKNLHDDKNGALTPSIWTSVVGKDGTTLTFYGVNFELSLDATEHRFCYFMGWIPHKTVCKDVTKDIYKMRVNHSAYSKPEYEHLALVLFHKKLYTKTVSTMKLK